MDNSFPNESALVYPKDKVDSGSSEPVRLPARVRKTTIEADVRAHGFVTVTDIAARLGVSEMTIRRDLVDLEKRGILSRTHGGAVCSEKPSGSVSGMVKASAFDQRLNAQRPAKEAIGRKVVERLGSIKSVAMSEGTSTYLLASIIEDFSGLNLFTNNLRIASHAAALNCDVYLPAGLVNTDELHIVGQSTISHFEQLWFDLAIVGASGMTENGIYDFSLEVSGVKKTLLKRADRKIVLCDSSKFGRMSLAQTADLSEFDELITECLPADSLSRALENSGVDIVVA